MTPCDIHFSHSWTAPLIALPSLLQPRQVLLLQPGAGQRALPALRPGGGAPAKGEPGMCADVCAHVFMCVCVCERMCVVYLVSMVDACMRACVHNCTSTRDRCPNCILPVQVEAEYFTMSATGVMRIKRGVQVGEWHT